MFEVLHGVVNLKNLTDLFNCFCLGNVISYAKPSIIVNLNFTADIPEAAEYTARTNVLVIQESASSMFYSSRMEL